MNSPKPYKLNPLSLVLDKFLKGQWDKEECVAEWKKYRDCLSERNGKLLTCILEVDGELNPTKQADSSIRF